MWARARLLKQNENRRDGAATGPWSYLVVRSCGSGRVRPPRSRRAPATYPAQRPCPRASLKKGVLSPIRPLHPDSMSFALLSGLLCALAGIVSASRITTVKLAFVIVHPREFPKLNASTCAFSVAFVLTCRSRNHRVSFRL